MAKWEDKLIRRDHKITCSKEIERFVENYTKDVPVRYMDENYKLMRVDGWVETVRGGHRLQVCSNGACNTFRLYEPGLQISWKCVACGNTLRIQAERETSMENYEKEFPKRIMKFSRALKKRHPELNSRKSRDKVWGNCIIVNGTRRSADRELRKLINIVGYEHNLHVNDFYRQEDNDGEVRVRFDLHDISPLFNEHFISHGHKQGIQERNR